MPPVVPELELKATYGLAAPEEFTLPDPDAQWTADVYRAFDITLMPAVCIALSITSHSTFVFPLTTTYHPSALVEI